MIDLGAKTVLVTGGSRGIGEAIVRAVAAAGATVVLHYGTSRSAAEAVQRDLGADVCRLIQADLGKAEGAADLWRAATDAASRIEVLVNNAGVFEATPVEAPGDDWHRSWARIMQVNLYAPAELCKLAILHFRSNGGGKIINVASRAAQRGGASNHLSYAASKGALLSLTKTIAQGFAPENILAFAMAPGFVETDLTSDVLDAAGRKRLLESLPLAEMANPEECGALAALLCSDVARHMTGATFDINGASYIR